MTFVGQAILPAAAFQAAHSSVPQAPTFPHGRFSFTISR
jgi:hypothetical protein